MEREKLADAMESTLKRASWNLSRNAILACAESALLAFAERERGPTAAEWGLIEAALAWRDHFTGDRAFVEPHHQRLSVAADAVIEERAPSRRYIVKPQPGEEYLVMDMDAGIATGVPLRMCKCISRINAERIAALLNAESRDG